MKRQRGVALLTALLAVALAVVLVAALLDRGEEARMRTAHALRGEQAWQLLGGVEAWAMRLLRDDNPGFDSRADMWAQPLAPVDVPGGRIGGSLREVGGCFNLNSLRQQHGTDHSEDMRERFERLLRHLRLPPNIAAAASDWTDADSDPQTGGAEDLQYRTVVPPYRAANRPFEHVSELRLVRGVDAEIYAELLPHVCALPDEDAPMNLNTASVELWMSLDERMTEARARRLARDGNASYSADTDVQSQLNTELGLPPETPLPPLVSIASSYFVVEADIRADDLPFLYSSLIYREGSVTRVLARVRGRW